MHGQVRNALIFQINFATIRSYKSNNHIETGGFTCSIWAQQADYFAAIDLEIDVVDNFQAFVLFAKVF